MPTTELSSKCHDYARNTTLFLKNTTGCSAVVFTWYQENSSQPPHFQLGADERMIAEYYDIYYDADPLRADRLIQSETYYETLSNARKMHDHNLLERYHPFLRKYQIQEELDLLFCAGGTPVASAALLMQDGKTESLQKGDLQEVHRYLQYAFSILPAVRLIELDAELESRYKLTPKERAVAELLVAGESNKSIAAQLGMELPTAKTHVLHIFDKLQVESRAKMISLLTGVC
ncbi:helix-turn-helix transcriptional regulator [Pseudomonas sp. USTB-Z]|jgi:DNA-binding CsgD family transcriptional regulator|uniref:helix-turn-helix transcriptional regulator n=1 Tax=Pseudomonas sp. USTB-Z TaxID=2794351 RepID=UPI001C83B934|nr:helix-turn-helix transcriptional regulator [Pseudomonas sp. USTB-Z]MBX6689777.1 helix-turn-helix transcriptional regulator [Pseudomonas sp. USTB-Z]